MSHPAYRDRIERARSGLLDAADQAELDRHLTSCEDCRMYRHQVFTADAELHRSLASLYPRKPVSSSTVQKMAFLARLGRRRQQLIQDAGQALRSLSLAALFVSAIIGLNWLFAGFQQPDQLRSATAVGSNGTGESIENASGTPVLVTPPGPETLSPGFVPFSRQLRLTLDTPGRPITALAFSPDGDSLAATGEDGTVWVFRVRDGALLQQFAAHDKEASSIAFSPDGRLLVTGGRDGEVKVWLSKTGAFVKTLLSVVEQIEDIQFSPSGDLLAVTLSSRSVTLVRISDGLQLDTYASSIRLDINQSADRNSYLIASAESAIWVRGDSNVPFTLNIQGQSGKTLDVVLSPNGNLLASGSTSGIVSLWKIYDITVVDETNTDGGSPRVSRTITGNLLFNLSGHTGWVNNLDFTADGQFLVSGGEDGKVILWNIADDRPVLILTGHAGPVTAVDISPKDSLIASGSEDGSVRIWTMEDMP